MWSTLGIEERREESDLRREGKKNGWKEGTTLGIERTVGEREGEGNMEERKEGGKGKTGGEREKE